MYEIMVEDTFASAHQLIGYEGPCENLHGHTWKVQVFIKGNDLDGIGMVFDFKAAKNILKNIIEGFDHKNLNALDLFKKMNPTAENIAKTVFDVFTGKIGNISGNKGNTVSKTIVWESEKTCAIYSL